MIIFDDEYRQGKRFEPVGTSLFWQFLPQVLDWAQDAEMSEVVF